MKYFKISIAFFLLAAIGLGINSPAWSWSGETWEETTRGEIVRRAELMMDLNWSPHRAIRNYGYPTEVYHTFNSYTDYAGVAYSQNNPQEDWSEFTEDMGNLEFSAGQTVITLTSLNMRTGAGTAFPVVTTLADGDTGTIVYDLNNGTQPAGSSFHWYHVNFSSQTGWCAAWSDSADYLAIYDTSGYSPGIGNDCSGFASICWGMTKRLTTSSFATSTYVDSLGNIGDCATAGLIVGDACNNAGSHIILFSRDLGGGEMESMEQTPWVARRRAWAWSSLGSYRPIRRKDLITSPTPPISTPTPIPPSPSPIPKTPTPIAASPSPTPLCSAALPLTEGFDGYDTGTRPVCWTFIGCDQDSDTYTTSANYGMANPSIKLDQTGDSIVSPSFSSPQRLTFWLKGVATDNTSSLLVEELYASSWRTLTDLGGLPTSGTSYQFNLENATTQIKFIYHKNSGNLAFDDVYIGDTTTVTTTTATTVTTTTATTTTVVASPTPISPSPSPVANSPTPIPPSPSPSPVTHSKTAIGDYNGDGTSDIALYRPSVGLWLVRGMPRIYFGGTADEPIPADYDGDGTWDYAYYRSSVAFWKVRNQTQFYFGNTGDVPVPADYDGDGSAEIAFFKPTEKLWNVLGTTRFYFGASSDTPMAYDFNGDGTDEGAIYRETSGLWKVRNLTQIYFGDPGDIPVVADYNGDGTEDMAWFRPSTKLWRVYNLTQTYFGRSDDVIFPADFNGDGTADYSYFRPSVLLWRAKGVTRVYFGQSADSQITNPY